MSYNFVKTLTRKEEFLFKFSICTLVSKPLEYQEMLDSFIAAGFNPDFCEYMCIDNSKTNIYDGYTGLNRFLREAKGKYIILCHQDILLHDHHINELEARIKEIDKIDNQWAILANAGGINLKHIGAHLTQNSGNRLLEKLLPLKAITIDENFILVKNEANLALSNDLNGFHMYGTDISIVADVLGFNAYIIDFNLTHKSDGNADESFYISRNNLMKKYLRAFRSRFISTTITRLYLSGNGLAFYLFNFSGMLRLARQYYKFFKPRAGYHPKT